MCLLAFRNLSYECRIIDFPFPLSLFSSLFLFLVISPLLPGLSITFHRLLDVEAERSALRDAIVMLGQVPTSERLSSLKEMMQAREFYTFTILFTITYFLFLFLTLICPS